MFSIWCLKCLNLFICLRMYNVPSLLTGETECFYFFKLFIDKCTLWTNGDISENEWYPVVIAFNLSTYLFIMIFYICEVERIRKSHVQNVDEMSMHASRKHKKCLLIIYLQSFGSTSNVLTYIHNKRLVIKQIMLWKQCLFLDNKWFCPNIFTIY